MSAWMRKLLAIIAVPAFAAVQCSSVAGGEPTDAYRRPAHFRIADEVVNENLQAFAATLPGSGIGNSLVNGNNGFEPVVYRNQYQALADSANRVIATPDALSQYDSLREGFLDGAEVRVYRVENGMINLVRQDRVAEGGFHVSGWIPLLPTDTAMPAAATSYRFHWDGYNRPGVPYYFTVRAVDRDGNVSPPAAAVSFERPKELGKDAAGSSPLTRLRLSGRAPAMSLPAPKNLRGHIDNGALQLEWDAVQATDLAGYLVYRSDYPPERQAGYYMQLARDRVSVREQIHAGDVVIVSKKFYTASRNRFFSNRVWGAEGETALLLPPLVGFFPDEQPDKTWQLVPHTPGTPVESAGETCLQLNLGPGVRETVGLYSHAGTAQSWYPVLEPRTYRVDVWLRQQGSGSVRFKVEGYYGSSSNAIAPIRFDVGPQWQRYTATFTPPSIQESVNPGRMVLEFVGPGRFYVDNFRVYRADADYLDFLPAEYAALAASRVSALRTHALVRTAVHTYDLQQLTNEGGAISGTGKGNTLPQLLRAVHKAGRQPWLQIEYHLEPREWLGLVEYLAAPYDPGVDTPAIKPWAYKRYRQGQKRPWVDEFDHILLELGNETWNPMFRPWAFPQMTDAATGKAYTAGNVYGLFQEHVIRTLRSSPYWRKAGLDEKFLFVLGGWGGLPYGREAAEMSPSSSYLTIGAYNGGWDEGEGPPRLGAASLFNVLSQVNQSAIPIAERHRQELAAINAGRRIKLHLGTYEAGPGYALNGLNGARVSEAQEQEQEQVMKSLAAGTATLDSFLARAYRGFDLQNFFGFAAGPLWASHAPWYRGGQAYPSWQLLSLFNNVATGQMLLTETLSVPMTDLKAHERRPGAIDAPLVAAYATREGGRLAVVVISRKVPGYPLPGDDGFTPVTIDLPFVQARSLTVYRMTGAPGANNLLSPRNVSVQRIDLGTRALAGKLVLNSTTGADDRGLPPASTFVYVFENGPRLDK